LHLLTLQVSSVIFSLIFVNFCTPTNHLGYRLSRHGLATALGNWHDYRECYVIEQAYTTYGPQAKCCTRKLLIWPAKPKFTSIWLDFNGNTIIFKQLTNLASKCFSNIFWPAMKSGLSIPIIWDSRLNFSRLSYSILSASTVADRLTGTRNGN